MVLSHATQAHGILLIATRPVPNSGQQYTWYLLLEVPTANLASFVKPTVQNLSSDTLSSFNQTNHSLCSISLASSLFFDLPCDFTPPPAYQSATVWHIPQPMRILFLPHLHYERQIFSHHYQDCPWLPLIHEPSIESASSYQCH
jgi:hypothetical protein